MSAAFIDAPAVDAEFKLASDYVAKLNMHNKIQWDYFTLYKQATVGPCSVHGGPPPQCQNKTYKAKWAAWNELGSMSKEEAKIKYVQALDKTDPEWKNKI